MIDLRRELPASQSRIARIAGGLAIAVERKKISKTYLQEVTVELREIADTLDQIKEALP